MVAMKSQALINAAASTETTIGMTPPASIFIGRKASARRAVDPDVRALLREYLEDVHKGSDTRLLEELGLCQGDVRVDVAVVNGELSGYEIKSPSDTLGASRISAASTRRSSIGHGWSRPRRRSKPRASRSGGAKSPSSSSRTG